MIEMWAQSFIRYAVFASVLAGGVSAYLGIVFSLSVSVAGVLVIFSYLVIPATAALVLDVGMGTSFVVAVVVAVVAGAGGVLVSYQYDLPTGPTIVATLSLLLFVCGVAEQLWRLGSVKAV